MAMPVLNVGAAILFARQPIQTSHSSPRKLSWESKKHCLCKAIKFSAKRLYVTDSVLQVSNLTKLPLRQRRSMSRWLEAFSRLTPSGHGQPVERVWSYRVSLSHI